MPMSSINKCNVYFKTSSFTSFGNKLQFSPPLQAVIHTFPLITILLNAKSNLNGNVRIYTNHRKTQLKLHNKLVLIGVLMLIFLHFCSKSIPLLLTVIAGHMANWSTYLRLLSKRPLQKYLHSEMQYLQNCNNSLIVCSGLFFCIGSALESTHILMYKLVLLLQFIFLLCTYVHSLLKMQFLLLKCT